MPMEMVARAKGSPMMRPTEKDDRPWFPYPFSILRSDGEPREPYEGISPEQRRAGGAKGVLRAAEEPRERGAGL